MYLFCNIYVNIFLHIYVYMCKYGYFLFFCLKHCIYHPSMLPWVPIISLLITAYHCLACTQCALLSLAQSQTTPLPPTPVSLYFLRQDQKTLICYKFPSPMRPWDHESRCPDLHTKHLAHSNFSVNTAFDFHGSWRQWLWPSILWP